MKKTALNNSTTTVRQATARLRYLRLAPRKVRLVAHMIKNLPVNEAEAQLALNTRKPAGPIAKLLQSAIANAKEQKLDLAKLVVKEIRVDKATMLKRFMPRAQGRATPIHKVTSHIMLVLQEAEKAAAERFVAKAKKVKKEAKKPEEKAQKAPKAAKIDIEKEKEQEKKTESKTGAKTADKGFTKKTFRRKSV
jgi:large subunit ribosomal protein L22